MLDINENDKSGERNWGKKQRMKLRKKIRKNEKKEMRES